MIKKIFKFILYLFSSIIGLIALFFLVGYLTYSKTYFECKGSSSVSKELFFTLEKYGTFTLFGNDSYGSMKIEVPNKLPMYYYAYIEELDYLLHIYQNNKTESFKGSFSLLSKDLALDTPVGFFDGRCEEIEK